MMARYAVLLYVALLGAALADAAGTCDRNEFKCKSGQCAHMLGLCNGITECGDRSDEDHAMCGKIPAVEVAAGETVEVRVDHQEHHQDVLFQLCGAEACGQVGAMGAAADGTLFWIGRSDCNAMGGNCQSQITWTRDGWKRFGSGPLVFEAQRSASEPSELAVWQRGRPDVRMTVAVPGDAGLLRVRPLYMHSDMPVEFRRQVAAAGGLPSAPPAGRPARPPRPPPTTTTSSSIYEMPPEAAWPPPAAASAPAPATAPAAPKTCEYHEFKCRDGRQCIKLPDLCNGEAECGDGSDEDRARCAKIPQTTIAVDEVVTARVQRKENHYDILFQLCDDVACSQIAAIGAAPDGSFFWTAHTDCNAAGGHCATQVMEMQEGWRRFLAGTLVFEVERSEDELAVWLKGRPERQMTVAVRPGSGRLRIRPLYMYSDMPVSFRRANNKPATTTTATPSPPKPALLSGGGGFSCGVAPLAPATLTVGGDKTDPGSYPWHAALYRRQDAKVEFICGGSLVSTKYIVTAAHCVFENDRKQSADRLAVGLGKLYSGWEDDEVFEVHKSNVSRVMVHPQYYGVRRKYADDVALVQMAVAVVFTEYIVPICLDGGLALTAGDTLRVVGWGAGITALKELETVKLKFQTFQTCLDAISHSPAEVGFMTTDKFCALRETGGAPELAPGLIQGDSGGGAAVRRQGRWYLAGVVSTAMDRGRIFGFSDVRTHGTWVSQAASEDPMADVRVLSVRHRARRWA